MTASVGRNAWLALGAALALALAGGAYATPPEGCYDAEMGELPGGNGQSVFDLTGSYMGTVGGSTKGTTPFPSGSASLYFDLEMDPQGRLFSGMAMNMAMVSTMDFSGSAMLDVNGAVMGMGTMTMVTLNFMLYNPDLSGQPFSARGRATLEVCARDGMMYGFLTLSGKWGKLPFRLSGPFDLDLPLGMDGSWLMHLCSLFLTDGKRGAKPAPTGFDGHVDCASVNGEKLALPLNNANYDPVFDRAQLYFRSNGLVAAKGAPRLADPFRGLYITLRDVQSTCGDDLAGCFALCLGGQTRRGAFEADDYEDY